MNADNARDFLVPIRRSARLLLCLFVMTSASILGAKELTTLNGRTYTEVEVRRIEPDGITISHSSGVGKVFYREMSAEDRTRFGYNPERHAAHATVQQERQATARILRWLEHQSINASATLIQVLDDGALARVTYHTQTQYVERVRTPAYPQQSSRSTSPFDDPFGAQRSSARTTYRGSMQSDRSRDEVRTRTISHRIPEPVYIGDIGLGHVDGDKWNGRLYPLGTYTYESALGAVRTVRRFTASQSMALEYWREQQRAQ